MRIRRAGGVRSRMAGISMVESLVALVIISVGMLGIAGLYLASLKAGRTANLRVQAVNLVSDMADRIRANKRGEAAYESASYGGNPEAIDCETVTSGSTASTSRSGTSAQRASWTTPRPVPPACIATRSP